MEFLGKEYEHIKVNFLGNEISTFSVFSDTRECVFLQLYLHYYVLLNFSVK